MIGNLILPTRLCPNIVYILHRLACIHDMCYIHYFPLLANPATTHLQIEEDLWEYIAKDWFSKYWDNLTE